MSVVASSTSMRLFRARSLSEHGVFPVGVGSQSCACVTVRSRGPIFTHQIYQLVGACYSVLLASAG